MMGILKDNNLKSLEKNIDYILLSKEEIDGKVYELAKKISEDYKYSELVLVGVLTGSIVFLSDLMRCLDVGCKIELIRARSYYNSDKSSGNVLVELDIKSSLKDKDILIVEDILDTGNSLFKLKNEIEKLGCKTVKTVALLDKPSRREKKIELDYRGFIIENEFVVGYGLDYAQEYRQLPYIGVLKK